MPRARTGVLAALALACAVWPAGHAGATGVQEPLLRPSTLARRPMSVLMLDAAAAGDRLVAVGERGTVLLSDNAGATWQQVDTPTSVTLTAVRFASRTQGWVAGHYGMIMATTDGGGHWKEQLDGVAAAKAALDYAHGLAPGEEQRERLVAEAERLVADGADKPFFDLYFLDERRGFAVGAYNLFFHTEDGGRTWRPCLDRLANPKGNHLYAIRGQGPNLYIAGEQGVLFRSTDSGRTFTRLPSPYAGSFFAMAVLPTGELIVAGLRGNVFRSVDSGDTWKRLEGLPPISWLASAVGADGNLWLGNQGGQVFTSRDKGESWAMVPQVPGVPALPLTGLLALGQGKVLMTSMRGLGLIEVPANPK